MSGRVLVFFECDHMRPVVKLDGNWHHIAADGSPEHHPCGCNFAYRQEAVSVDSHALVKRAQP
jgi:hypothetical protein